MSVHVSCFVYMAKVNRNETAPSESCVHEYNEDYRINSVWCRTSSPGETDQ